MATNSDTVVVLRVALPKHTMSGFCQAAQIQGSQRRSQVPSTDSTNVQKRVRELWKEIEGRAGGAVESIGGTSAR